MPFFDLSQSELDSYRSSAKAPADFDKFWNATLSEARSFALDPKFERVDLGLDLFDTYGVQVLAGRNFTPADAATPEAVIVNHSFAQMYLQDGNALGVRFKYVPDVEGAPVGGAPPQRWLEVVGVVRDFPAFPPDFVRAGEPTIYHAANVGDGPPTYHVVKWNSPGENVNRRTSSMPPRI